MSFSTVQIYDLRIYLWLNHLRVDYELTWPACSWLDSSVGRALHRYRRSWVQIPLKLELFFQASISQLLRLFIYNCDDQSCLHVLSLSVTVMKHLLSFWHITEFYSSLHVLYVPVLFSVQQDSIQKILLSLTFRIAETHLIHEKRRILSMYRLFVLLLLKDLPSGLGDTWAFFIRDVIYSLLRIISDETQSKKQPRQQQVNLVVDDDLFLPCCNLIYYVCKAAVECCSQVR